MTKITDKDLYGILEVEEDATEKEILKAYRKKALKCHPDKNPDNPKAADLFHELSSALEILGDTAARTAYDQTLKAKKASHRRHQELDSKRKKFKEDLEAREKQYSEQQQKAQEAKWEKNLKAEVERLRKEGSSILEQEQERLREEIQKEQHGTEESKDATAPRLKIRWKSKKSDSDNGGYSYELLHKAFSKYGDVTALVLSSKKKGSAIVEFASHHTAVLAEQVEVGLPSNPLTVTWLSGKPSASATGDSSVGKSGGATVFQSYPTSSSTTLQSGSVADSPDADRDFESLVLRRLRQAEERKKLEEAILADDTEKG